MLGARNISIVRFFLFVAVHHQLPGGGAATIGVAQPLVVIVLAHFALDRPVRRAALLAAAAGLIGVALLVQSPQAALDPTGVAAALAGNASMAAGTVPTRRRPSSVPLVTFTAWQIAAGGLLLLQVALRLEPIPTSFSAVDRLALVRLGLVGTARTYILWFQTIARFEPSVVSSLGLLRR